MCGSNNDIDDGTYWYVNMKLFGCLHNMSKNDLELHLSTIFDVDQYAGPEGSSGSGTVE
jgi:hypothetical protein